MMMIRLFEGDKETEAPAGGQDDHELDHHDVVPPSMVTTTVSMVSETGWRPEDTSTNVSTR
jgi:hypothetical protein